MAAAAAPVSVIRDAPRAGVLLKPLRREILGHARTPVSAAGIAAAMGRPRQVVNYHVRELARAGFLRKAGRAKKRGLTEQRYVVSAQAYVLAPEMLGALDATATTATTDKASAAYLLMLATRLQRELSESWRKADASGTALPLLSLDTEFGFASVADRARFAQALTSAITTVVAEHTTIAERACDPSTPIEARGKYRLVLGCYPTPEGT
jgi:predicted ArsR family transcriptional regulator